MKKKKVLKIIIIIILLIMLVGVGIFIWYRYSKIDKNETKAYKNIMKYFSHNEYNLEYRISNDYVSVNLKTAQKDEKVFIQELQNEKEILCLIYIDPLTISLDNTNKTYSIREGRTEQVDSLLDSFLSIEQLENTYTTEYEKGKETIDGINYNYESFNSDEGKTVYYFVDDELKFFKYVGNEGEETKIEILSYSNTVDDNIFIVPEDYTNAVKQDTDENTQTNVEQNVEENIEQDVGQNTEQNTQQNLEQNQEQDIDPNMQQNVEENIEQDVEQNVEENTEQDVGQDPEQNLEQDIDQNIQQNF